VTREAACGDNLTGALKGACGDRGSASIKESGRIQWNRLEPTGVGGLQSKSRFQLRSGRNQKRFLTVSDDFRRPASASLARQDEQARPRLPVAAPSPAVRDVLGLPELSAPPKQSTAADGGAWKGNQSIGDQSIGEPMEGVDFYEKPLRSLRSQSMESARSRHAGPNRSTGQGARTEQAVQVGRRAVATLGREMR
jgi:hypothetical protein